MPSNPNKFPSPYQGFLTLWKPDIFYDAVGHLIDSYMQEQHKKGIEYWVKSLLYRCEGLSLNP